MFSEPCFRTLSSVVSAKVTVFGWGWLAQALGSRCELVTPSGQSWGPDARMQKMEPSQEMCPAQCSLSIQITGILGNTEQKELGTKK